MILPPKPDLFRRLASRFWLVIDLWEWVYDEIRQALRG